MKKATPVEYHPPPLFHVVKTAAGCVVGAKYARGIIMAKKPRMCNIKMRISMAGSALPRIVLRARAMVNIPQNMSVLCHRSGT
jgi:hypothetical protein